MEKNTTIKQAIVYALSFYRHDSIADVVNDALLSEEDELQLEALHTAVALADEQFEKRIVEIKNYLWIKAGMEDALAYLKFIRKQKEEKRRWKYFQSR